MEEVVITAKPPLIIQKGDTTEFNANALKVPEDAELEDLLKKLPGFQKAGYFFTKNGRLFTICLQLKGHLSSLLRTDRAGDPCYNKVIK